jgi:hypothetical protein
MPATSRKHLEIEERRKKVAANMLAGLSSRDMEGPLGVSHGTIISDMKAIFKQLRDETVATTASAVDMQERRLNRALNAIWQRVLDGDLEAIAAFLRIEERRARLRCLDGTVTANLNIGGNADAPPIRAQIVTVDPDEFNREFAALLGLGDGADDGAGDAEPE